MSNLGFQVVYRILNELPDVSCERVFYRMRIFCPIFEPAANGSNPWIGTPRGDFHLLAFPFPSKTTTRICWR